MAYTKLLQECETLGIELAPIANEDQIDILSTAMMNAAKEAGILPSSPTFIVALAGMLVVSLELKAKLDEESNKASPLLHS